MCPSAFAYLVNIYIPQALSHIPTRLMKMLYLEALHWSRKSLINTVKMTMTLTRTVWPYWKNPDSSPTPFPREHYLAAFTWEGEKLTPPPALSEFFQQNRQHICQDSVLAEPSMGVHKGMVSCCLLPGHRFLRYTTRAGHTICTGVWEEKESEWKLHIICPWAFYIAVGFLYHLLQTKRTGSLLKVKTCGHSFSWPCVPGLRYTLCLTALRLFTPFC